MTLAPVVCAQGRYIDVTPQYPADAVDPGLTPPVSPAYTQRPNQLYKEGATYFLTYHFSGPYPSADLKRRGYTWDPQARKWAHNYRWHAPDGWITHAFYGFGGSGHVHWNPSTNEIYATSGANRHEARLTGVAAARLMAHARNSLFRG